MVRNKKKILGGTLLLIVLLFLFRVQLLQNISSFLVYEDELSITPVMFVLSGGPLDRGNEAVKLYKEGWAPLVICTGENVPHNFEAIGIDSIEGAVTRYHMVESGVPLKDISLIRKGTSTKEEAQVILEYCKSKSIPSAIVVSSEFHTRRVKRVFQQKFAESNINIIIQGAPSSAYDINYWWTNENGLIDVNNEYIKLIYYWIKY